MHFFFKKLVNPGPKEAGTGKQKSVEEAGFPAQP